MKTLLILVLLFPTEGYSLTNTDAKGPPCPYPKFATRLEARLSPELSDLLVKLIQTPSVNGKDNEENVVAQVEQFAQAHGINAERFEGAAGRPVLMLEVGPEDVPALLIVAHTDTVTPGDPARWSHPPFGGEIKDGRLYGRGAVDNKGGLIAGLDALLRAKANGGRVHIKLACVPDEEAGATGNLGIKLLGNKGKLDAAGAIYAYPGLNKIGVGARGLWRFQIIVAGESSHTGGAPWQKIQGSGGNAISAAADLTLAIESLSQELETKKGKGHFAKYTSVLSPVMTNGGQGYNTGPERAALNVDGRLIPDTDLAELKKKISEKIAEVGKKRPGLEFRLIEDYYIPPTQIPDDSPIVKAIQKSSQALRGRTLRLEVSGPTNESYLLNERKIPTVVLGPTGNHYHAPDEYVDLDSIDTAGAIYYQTARSLAGANP